MALIDLSNYDSLLVQSSVGRAGTPDGNIFFDVANGILEIITVEEQATIDMTQHGGGASDPNPLSEDDGIKLEAAYAFENQERRTDETLRQYDRFLKGTFKFGGAYEFINGRTLYDTDKGGADSNTGDDRFKIRGSGCIERDAAGDIGRIYYGNKSLGAILALSQPYRQLSDGGAPVDYNKDGPIDEMVQVYGDIAVDSNTTTFDTRIYEALSIRTFGQTYDRKILADSGVSEMGGYSSGFALGEGVHLTSGNYTLADVYGGGQTAPWTTMGLEELDTPQTETGFNEVDGDFTWVLNNTIGDLDQMVAFLDALAQTDDDINDHAVNTTNGKRVGTWYSYNAAGKVVTNSPFAGEGLFLEVVPTADKQRVIFTDDAGATKSYPFEVSLIIAVGSIAVADVLSWYHAFFLDGPGGNDYNTANALTVEDSSAVEIKGNVSTDAVGNSILRAFDYDGDTIGGTAGTDKDVVFLVEGDGGAVQVKTLFTISQVTTINATAAPGQENNV